MTAYFDNINRRITHGDLEDAIQSEALVIQDVNLVCGDREFPDDMREKMMQTIAVGQMAPTYGYDGFKNSRAIEYFKITHSSRMVIELHGLFHVLAEKRVATRFGLLSDDPKDILNQRHHFDTVKG